MITQEEIPYTWEECKAMVKTIAQLRKEKKELLDKVCEWLGNHNNYQRVHDNGGGVRFDMTQCIFDLRKAMKGE